MLHTDNGWSLRDMRGNIHMLRQQPDVWRLWPDMYWMADVYRPDYLPHHADL